MPRKELSDYLNGRFVVGAEAAWRLSRQFRGARGGQAAVVAAYVARYMEKKDRMLEGGGGEGGAKN